ncbi:MAG: ATP-binding cassette domain-containing protein, partial [Parvularculaceae bacterium]|nr:ATP-binding cassette domain-containing protein [Parvularculaceae bacterium]
EGRLSGKRVIVAEKLSKSYGDRTVVRDFSIEIARGDRVGVVGPNGAGKTTLLRLLTGVLTPDSGSVEIGSGIVLVSLDQRRAALDPDMRVADAINDGRGDWVEINGEKRHVASYLKDFLFAPAQFKAPVSALSGGERGRLALAAALARPSNLLVLDEPTNDLDLETLDLLEETLADYPGTLLVVSHDRSFLDRVATSIVAPPPESETTSEGGRWLEYVGGYEDMIAQRGSAPGVAAPRPLGAPPQRETRSDAPRTRAEKLSFKEQHALKTLPERIDALSATIARLKLRLADPALFARDAAAFNSAAADLQSAEQSLAAAEEEWLALEMKRESLEG